MLWTRGKVTGRVARRSTAAVGACAAAALLAACGHNDSTATGSPSVAPPVVTAPAAAGAQTPPPEPPSERPQPVPPPTDTPQMSGRDQAFLDGLRQRGINPSSNDIALTTAQYICQSKATGVPDDQIATFVNAMAGSDPGFDPQKMPVEQAGKAYVDVATATYCNR